MGAETSESGGRQTFSVKGQVVNILDFMGHIVSLTTAQLCCCSRKAGRTIHEQMRLALFQKILSMDAEICISVHFRVSQNLLPLIFLKRLICLEQFSVHSKIKRKVRRFLVYLLSHMCAASTAIDIPTRGNICYN